MHCTCSLGARIADFREDEGRGGAAPCCSHGVSCCCMAERTGQTFREKKGISRKLCCTHYRLEKDGPSPGQGNHPTLQPRLPPPLSDRQVEEKCRMKGGERQGPGCKKELPPPPPPLFLLREKAQRYSYFLGLWWPNGGGGGRGRGLCGWLSRQS